MKEFEKKSKELENIIISMQDENISLDKAMKQYEIGVLLSKKLSDMISEAEGKVKVLSSDNTEAIFDEEV